jgi:hypothetical protein
MEPTDEFFSPDYATARQRFRSQLAERGIACQSWALDCRGPLGEELTIDAAILGDRAARSAVVISTGLHGVEGFFGSAAMLAFLKARECHEDAASVRVILWHSLNPFGFAWRRRANEDNVDLNRNFLLARESYRGHPPLYERCYRLFNPQGPPSWWEPWLLKAALAIARHGRGALTQALPVGQYDYPQGLFFGGSGPSATHRIVAQALPDFLRGADRVLHLDFHTGLGPRGVYQLLVDGNESDPRVLLWRAIAGADKVSVARPDQLHSGAPYASRGTWEHWCQATFADRAYCFATAEFGTYDSVRVVKDLRNENRAWHYAAHGDPRYEWTWQALVEAFSPAGRDWRERVVADARVLILKTLAAAGKTDGSSFAPPHNHNLP